MFHVVEKYKTPAQIILGLICLSFVFAGGYTIAAPGTDYISKVGDIKININEVNDFQRRFQNASKSEVSKQDVYAYLLEQAYAQQQAKDLGISASLDQIKQIIASDPSFQENGQFSESKYRQFLDQSGLSEQNLIDSINKQYALQSMQNLLKAGNMVSDVQAKQIIDMLQSTRQIQSVNFNGASYANQVKVDDAKLQAYYNANKKRYFLPQGIKFEFVQISVDDLAKKEVVSPEELKMAYDQIPTSASEPKPEFDTIKQQLTEQIQMRKASLAIAKIKEELSDLAFKNPKSLQPISDKLGLKIYKDDKKWTTKDMAKAQRMPQALLDALFSNDIFNKRFNSEVIDLGDGRYRVVRAIDTRKEHQGNFAEVKDVVEENYIEDESQKLALAAANAALNDLLNGRNPSLSWSETADVTPEQFASALLPKEDYLAWIKSKPINGKPAYLILKKGADPVLVKVHSITPPKNLTTIMPQAKELISNNLARNLASNNFGWLQTHYKIKTGAQKLQTDEQ